MVRGKGRLMLGVGGRGWQPDGQVDGSVRDQERRDQPSHCCPPASRATFRSGTAMRTTDRTRPIPASESRVPTTQGTDGTSAPAVTATSTPRRAPAFITRTAQSPFSGVQVISWTPVPDASATQKSAAWGALDGATAGGGAVDGLAVADLDHGGVLHAGEVGLDAGCGPDAEEDGGVAGPVGGQLQVAQQGARRQVRRGVDVQLLVTGGDRVRRGLERLVRAHQEAVVVAGELVGGQQCEPGGREPECADGHDASDDQRHDPTSGPP